MSQKDFSNLNADILLALFAQVATSKFAKRGRFSCQLTADTSFPYIFQEHFAKVAGSLARAVFKEGIKNLFLCLIL